MSRLFAAVCLFLASVAPALAQSGPLAVKVRFDIHESGSFGLKTLKELGTKEAAAMVTAVCAIFEVDCSQEANAGAKAIKTMVVGDKAEGEEHHGIYRSPVGYTICKAKIDMAHASVDGQSSFSGEIVRDPHDDGLGFYAEVPKFRPEGHSVKADLYLEFIPATPGALAKYSCWPTSDHSPAAHLWNCHNGCNPPNLKPEARYP